jgi:hypothetical protein
MDLDLLPTLCCRGALVVGAGHPPNHLPFDARANSDMWPFSRSGPCRSSARAPGRAR